MTTPEHMPAQTQNDIGLAQTGPKRSWAAGLTSRSRTIALVVATALVGSASAFAAGGTSDSSTAITKAGVELGHGRRRPSLRHDRADQRRLALPARRRRPRRAAVGARGASRARVPRHVALAGLACARLTRMSRSPARGGRDRPLSGRVASIPPSPREQQRGAAHLRGGRLTGVFAVLVTGPPGSGKTVTLTALLDALAEDGIHHAGVDVDEVAWAYPFPDLAQRCEHLRAWRDSHARSGATLLVVAEVIESRAHLADVLAALGADDHLLVRLHANPGTCGSASSRASPTDGSVWDASSTRWSVCRPRCLRWQGFTWCSTASASRSRR